MAPTEAELAELRRVLPVSRETVARFARYRDLLETWQKKTNLVAPGTLPAFWTRHVADSLQALALFPEARRWMDLGSGAGFPGMAIAIANAASPERSHTLVESNARKCAFLREAARATGANAEIICERIESVAERYAGSPERPDLVTARALAPLARLIGLGLPLLAAGATGLFHKGREFQAEIAECRGLWRFDLVIHESRIEAGSVLLEIRNPVRSDARRDDGGAA